MKHVRTIARLQADLRALEASADRAGLALACAFSNAEEFEAAVIRERRAAGLIGSPHLTQMHHVLAATATVALAALIVFIV